MKESTILTIVLVNFKPAKGVCDADMSLPATIKSLAESLLDTFIKLQIEMYNVEKKITKIGQG
jgi:hypothetical protein